MLKAATASRPNSFLFGNSPRLVATPRRTFRVQATSSPSVLQRLGRVLKEKAAGDFERFFQGTSKTRERLGLVEELFTFWKLDDYEETLEELEEALIAADFGPKTALKVVDDLRDQVKAGKLKTGEDIRTALRAGIVQLLGKQGGTSELQLTHSPSLVLVVGVNGAGKTTTIGKIAHKLSTEGAKVYLAPGDTFRAAAAEQLAVWAERSGAVMGPFKAGAKPQDLLAQCCKEAVARGDIDVILADTSGRLHTAYGLMEELAAVKKSIGTAVGGRPPDEVLLVLDGTTGLNMLNQAREFNEVVGLTGLILTKLDGSARGGAIVSVVDALRLPVKFVGVGEALEDLQPFDADAFADALFPKST